jgi:phosphoglycerate dehydrogenase-like enzyme
MSSRPLVAVTDYLSESSIEAPMLEGLADLRLLLVDDEKEVVRMAANASALLVYHVMKMTEYSLTQLPQCKVIVRGGVGVDNIDLETAGRLGIVVCNVPDYGSEEVADHALLLLLATARRLVTLHSAIVQGVWDASLIFGAPRLRGCTVGIIGCGRIGSAFALRAKALGMRVVIYDPYQPAGLDKSLGVERVFQLDELLKQAQFLSVHCPLTKETHHIVDDRAINLLPQGAMLINTARGGCVDLDAVLRGLDSGRLAAAGLDVIECEPLDHERARKHPRIIFTPHAAYYSVEGYKEMRRKGVEEVIRVLRGEPVRNPVNVPFLKNPRCKVPAMPARF